MTAGERECVPFTSSDASIPRETFPQTRKAKTATNTER